MRFGRKRSNWSNPARMFWGDRGDESNGAATLAPEEQAALRADLDMEGAEFSDAPMFTPEPTERLLSTLGKFQRQLSKAENGADSEEWTDECIDQIIQGIEIAQLNGWDAIQEALTDTARVLQSYENVDRAADAVPFLHDSYEILCLIVGDIIVDSVGPSVVNKWRQRYQRALQELDGAGIALVDDDGEAPEPSAAPIEEEVSASRQDMPLSNDWETALTDHSDAFSVEAPWEDASDSAEEAPHADHPADFGEEAHEDYTDAPREEATAEQDTEEDFILPALSEEQPAFDAPGQTADTFDEHGVTADSVEAAQDPAEDASALADESDLVDDAEAEPEAEGESLADDDALATDTESDGTEDAAVFEEEDETHSEAEEDTDALDTFDAVADPVSPESAALHQETLFDFDDADASGQESLDQASSALTEDLAESPLPDSLGSDAPALETEEPVDDAVPADAGENIETPAELSPDSPEALLLTVQQAMAQGDVAHAKALALKLAAQMADMEVVKARDAVQDAESLLAANRDAIAEAEAQVAAAETALQEMEEAIAARETDAAKQRDETEKLRGEMSGVETEIESIEARIRELEAQRDAEKTKLAGLESTLQDQQAEESRIQTDLEALAEAEQSERERLEDARTGVGQLEQERNTREAAVSEAEKLLEVRQASSGEIARTLHPGDDA